jgi:hypothetical protein
MHLVLWVPSGWERSCRGKFVRPDGIKVRSATRRQWFVEVPSLGVIPGEDGFQTEPFDSWRKAIKFADSSFPREESM